jgi:hypothetical protein
LFVVNQANKSIFLNKNEYKKLIIKIFCHTKIA